MASSAPSTARKLTELTRKHNPTPATAKWHVYRIDVKVSWGDKRAVEIVSMRTAADAPTLPGVRSR